MHVLLSDETNTTQTANSKFLIYGGITFPIAKMTPLNDAIAKIRYDAGYFRQDKLKFDTNTRPQNVSIEVATDAKRKVVEVCREHGVRFFAHIILHDIIRNQPVDQQLLWW